MTRSAAVVDKLAGALSARMSRRGFFARSAVVGTAVAANPVTYTLMPNDAYAAICSCSGQGCNCGSMCCDGYTEFCCTLTGRNQCPPGSLLAGWWKVDGTGFCDGPRYYMDCNAPCNGCGCGASGICDGGCSGTPCGCGNGDCNNRKAGCTRFRYGQCNQGTACVGPIICRIVTCIAPWEIDGTCTTTVRVDNATAYHDRPCLHGVLGTLDVAEEVPGGLRVAGWAFDWDTNRPIDVRFAVDNVVVGQVRADGHRPDVAATTPGMGPSHGYDVVLPVSVRGTQTVCAAAVNVGPGSDAFIGCRTVTSRNPFGTIDDVVVGQGTVTISGWALDPDSRDPIDVHVYANGVGRVFTADVARPDVAATVPGAGPRHGYRATFPVPAGTVNLEVHAINRGPGRNVLLATRTVEIGAPFGNIDTAVPTAGGVRLQGWAVDPDTRDPIQVHCYIAGKGVAVDANVPRPDVAATVPGAGPRHGFDTVIPASPGVHDVVVYAINDRAGSNTLIGVRRVEVRSGSPFGTLDVVASGPGSVFVAGWVLDPDHTGPIDVHVYVDGVGTPLRADQARPDVAAAYPGYGAVRGFSAEIPAPAGLRQVCVYGINVGPGGNSLIGCRSTLVGGEPFGSLDVVTPRNGAVRLQGWAIDPDTRGPTEVHVYVDGVGTPVVASTERPDVGQAYPLYGSRHGFDVTVPAPRGARTVCAYVINTAGAGSHRLLSCRTVNVP